MFESFLIVGAGGHAKVVADALIGSGCSLKGFYDDNLALLGTEPIAGAKVVGPTDRIVQDYKLGDAVIVAIGDNRTRRNVALRLGADYGVAVAPSVIIGSRVNIGPGSMVLPSATINIGSIIGRHVILNTSCSIDHDCRIEDFVHIAPGTHLGGNVNVGEGTFLGIGSSVVPGVRIGRWSVVGAGAVVTKDIPDNCTAVGVPARVIKTREEGWHLK